MKIGAVNIGAGVEKKVFSSLLPFVSVEKQARIKGFMFDKDKYRCLFGELLSRVMLREFVKGPVEFCILPSGKPVLVGAGVHFNVSHSGDWVVCVVDEKEVGIDVEEVTDIDLSVSENFFCPKEHEDILNAEDSVERFFEYWTLKESYIKFIGEGLAKPLNEFCVEFLEGEVRVDGAYFKQYEIGEGYKLAVCAGEKGFTEGVVFYSVEELLRLVSLSDPTRKGMGF
ncbi:MAG TPA: 4'-phosphopantetheinyl transferase superfamily protein [Chitinophagaceae bacterium]|nr:4'-phosphopantetheinyl transferase superfamily protein [Chitinophagaceae bacterium]